ncbi:hypothetical protein DEU56DRAFT_404169 [Suillus clintonianus]|uniref:uncharacterized protein n=1 Tax=Suillus clintonianus TaxID=1904413 RepID=UPI001B875CEE|nr:uncharacterized protein DEU56DRAFT_404169 [Suillus clintonianus]KAG2134801.1 hypothetical protein DEU56DRAFT_404169 [Suillus clintonianus]
MLPNTLPDHISSQILEQLEKKSQQHILASDLEIRTRNMMKCFANTPGTLPLPSPITRNAWTLLPNEMAHPMTMPLKAGVISPRAPPTTPMDDTFAVADESSSTIYETCTPTSDTVALGGVASDTCSTVDVSEGRQPNADEKSSHETNDPEETALPLSDQDHSYPSDTKSMFVMQPGESPVLAAPFEEIVDAKMKELRIYGLGFVTECLLAAGLQSVESGPLISKLVQSILQRIKKESRTQAKRLEMLLRLGSMEMFRRHWKSNGHWRHISSTSGRHSDYTLMGVNKAGLVGSLFSAKVMMAEDISLCLSMLLEEIHFDRLCAMHALLLYADDRLCKTANLPALMQFQTRLRLVDPRTDMYLWGPVPDAQAMMQDIFDTIEGWMAIQAHRREQLQYRTFLASCSGRKPPLKTVGPRMRVGRMRNKA